MAKHGKKADRKGKKIKHREARSRRPLDPTSDLTRTAPAALAVAVGALVVAGITSVWRTRR